MKAIVIKEFGGANTLHLEELPIPAPKDNEIQFLVFYTGVNPVDWKIREGMLKERLPHEFPIIPGWEASGEVTAVGKNVKDFYVGDEIFSYCRNPVVHSGTYAEYVCYDADHVAKKPRNITFAQAAALPLVSLTAWQSLFDAAKLRSGETILIHAGAGGVGSMAIQFAKNAGAKVYTTASKRNHNYVKKLGADFAIDYREEKFADAMKKLAPQGVDVVFDTMGGDTLQESLQVLKSGGRLVSILEKLDPAVESKYRIKGFYVFVSPNGEQLKTIADLITQGKVIPPHIEEFPLSRAAAAQEKLQEGHVQGKIVLRVK